MKAIFSAEMCVETDARHARQDWKESDQQRRTVLNGLTCRGGGFARRTKIPCAVRRGAGSANEGSGANSVPGRILMDVRSTFGLSTVSVQVSRDCTAGPCESDRCFAQQRSSIGSMAMCFPGSTHKTEFGKTPNPTRMWRARRNPTALRKFPDTTKHDSRRASHGSSLRNMVGSIAHAFFCQLREVLDPFIRDAFRRNRPLSAASKPPRRCAESRHASAL